MIVLLSISIHTFLAEGDFIIEIVSPSSRNFNPHLPCGRRRPQQAYCITALAFQSTPSLRKATLTSLNNASIQCISIHTFLAEGDISQVRPGSPSCHFNPHLPCGRRPLYGAMLGDNEAFQSTPSLRKATCPRDSIGICRNISIHTFLAEGDSYRKRSAVFYQYFNPHLPCGRRQNESNYEIPRQYFNPHLPCGRRHLFSFK